MKTYYSSRRKLSLRKLLFGALGAGLIFAANAQAQEEADDDENLEELEGFYVTGSLIRRTDSEGPAPVLSISRDDIENSGFQQVSDLIRNLPINNGLTEADATASFAADGAYANLRGIGPGGTLVLVNGRRLAPYGAADFLGRSFVDLNSFPVAAIDRVDILKTGASAIYGSDALGGAINIILRKDFEGLEVDAFYGNTTRGGDFGTKRVSATMGTSSAKGSLMVVANYLKRKPLYMRERDFSASGNYADSFTAQQYNDEYLAQFGLDIDVLFQKTSRGQGRTPNFLFEGFNMSSAGYPGRFDLIGGSDNAWVTYQPGYLFAGDGSDAHLDAWEYANFNDHITHISGAERKGVVIMGDYEIMDNVTAFIEGNYQSNYAETEFAPAPSFGDWTIPATNPYNPTNPANGAFYNPIIFTRAGLDPADYPEGSELTMTVRASDAGNRLFETYSDFFRVATGLSIELDEIDWVIEPSFMFVESKLEDVTRNLLVLETMQDFLNNTMTSADTADPSMWAVNPFVTGPGQFDNEILYNEYIKTDDTRLSRSELNLWEVRATGPILSLEDGDLMLAVGAETRTERLEDRPSLASQRGQLVGSGGTSSSGSRDAWAMYAELVAPISVFEIQVATRYEDYDDFGDTGFKPQVGVKIDPTDFFSIRIAYADNFKAPSLAQAYAGVQRGFIATEDLIRFPITGDAIDSPDQQKETRTGGNPTLQPEESESVSAGIIFSPSGKLEGLEIAIDYWRIEATSLITTQTEGDILDAENDAWEADPAAFLAMSPTERLAEYNVFRLPNENFGGSQIPGQIVYINSVYENLDILEVDGVDIEIDYVWPTDDMGVFRFGTFWTYYNEYVDNTAGIDDVGTFRLPELRGNFEATWEYGDWFVAGLINYVDGYEDLRTWDSDLDANGEGQGMIGSYTTLDLRVRYSGLWDTEFTVGIDNVFDRDPPFMQYDNSGYDPAFADPIGQFIWMSVKKAF